VKKEDSNKRKSIQNLSNTSSISPLALVIERKSPSVEEEDDDTDVV
jgi:hypothetical protein